MAEQLMLPLLDEDKAVPAPLAEARKMLDEAEAALEEGNPELGWGLLKASNRSLIHDMSQEQLLSRARQILREASDDEKGLTAWRKAAVRELLAGPDGTLDNYLWPKGAERVEQAAKILDVHHDNVYQRQSIIRGRLAVLALMTAAALASWIALLPPPSELGTPTANIDKSWKFWLTVFLSGVTGALISCFTATISRKGGANRIPVELDFTTVMFARVALGSLSALAVTTFLAAGFLKLGEQNSYGLVLAAAIVSGFSERLLLRAIESAGG